MNITRTAYKTWVPTPTTTAVSSPLFSSYCIFCFLSKCPKPRANLDTGEHIHSPNPLHFQLTIYRVPLDPDWPSIPIKSSNLIDLFDCNQDGISYEMVQPDNHLWMLVTLRKEKQACERYGVYEWRRWQSGTASDDRTSENDTMST